MKIKYFLLIQCTLLFLTYFHKQIDRSHEIIIFLAFPLLYISNYYFYLYLGVSIFGPCFKSIGKKTEEPNWKFHPSFHLPSTELFWSNLFLNEHNFKSLHTQRAESSWIIKIAFISLLCLCLYRFCVIMLQVLWVSYSNIFDHCIKFGGLFIFFHFKFKF
jgi:hypothetical protein